ncbi:TA system antitoxin ParD family protein [Gordonia sp. (in: high G+C Gram-positive bacteria)]|uniref:TA system antitoxin ParD family protein n=1 Tax=Gordonia sp. (in: high G+C Gram-positive bacteria) TaxID=84139 RepID=UPI003F9C652D
MTAASTGRSGARRKSKKDADRATRFSAELFESAQAVGEVENRSARQQLEYWASAGRAVTAPNSSAQSRIESVFAGTLSRQSLTDDEVRSFDAQFDARAEARMAAADIPERRAAEGHRSFHLDSGGRIVETRPDGTETIVE